MPPISIFSAVEKNFIRFGYFRIDSVRLPFSSTTCVSFCLEASIAQASPQGPPPTTTISNISIGLLLFLEEHQSQIYLIQLLVKQISLYFPVESPFFLINTCSSNEAQQVIENTTFSNFIQPCKIRHYFLKYPEACLYIGQLVLLMGMKKLKYIEEIVLFVLPICLVGVITYAIVD